MKRTWDLHRRKETLPPPEFVQQADELAQWMIDTESGQVATFVGLPPGWKVITPDVQAHLDRGNEYCRLAHAAIQQHDSGKASTLVRFAMGEQALAAMRTTQGSSISPDEMMANAAANSEQAKTTFEMLKMQAQVSANIKERDQKEVQNEDKGVKEAQTRIDEIKKAQEEVIRKGEQANETAKDAKPDEQKSADCKTRGEEETATAPMPRRWRKNRASWPPRPARSPTRYVRPARMRHSARWPTSSMPRRGRWTPRPSSSTPAGSKRPSRPPNKPKTI